MPATSASLIFLLTVNHAHVLHRARLRMQATPAWSPAGDKIAFASDRAGTYQIYVMNADGSNQMSLTNTSFQISVGWQPVVLNAPPLAAHPPSPPGPPLAAMLPMLNGHMLLAALLLHVLLLFSLEGM